MKKILTAFVLACLFTSSIMACGPRRFIPIFYSRDKGQIGDERGIQRYGDTSKPYIPLKEYIKGNLGIVRPQYAVEFLWIAYRNLTNKPFLSEEVDLLLKLEDVENNPPQYTNWHDKWIDSCSSVLGQKQEAIPTYVSTKIKREENSELISFENCTNNAFQHAHTRLDQLKSTHGNKSEALLQWVKNQKKVFENCGLTSSDVILPDALPANATTEQKQDHQYQLASSYFYAMDYEKSAELFEEIANNPSSPHKDIALYLVFRSHFRNIQYKNAPAESFFNVYERLKNKIEQAPYKEDIEGFYLHLKFKGKQPLIVMNGVINKLSNKVDESKAWLYHELRYLALSQKELLEGTQKLENEFWEWRRLLRSENSYQEVLEQWKKNPSALWLIVVLDKASHDAPELPDLIAAAEKIEKTSPSYFTVNYQIARLCVLTGDKAKANQVIDNALKHPNLNLATKNRFLDLKAECAKSFSDFLENILQKSVDIDKDPYQRNPFSPFLSVETASDKNLEEDIDWEHFYTLQNVPISALKEAGDNIKLPQWLRTRLLIAAWVRSILLDRIEDAKDLAHKLSAVEPQFKDIFNLFITESNPQRQRYIAHLLILRSPSLSIFIYPNAWRNKATNWRRTGIDLSVIDTQSGLRENWWKDSILKDLESKPTPRFLTLEEKENAEKELKQLEERVPFKSSYFCELALKWFKEMPHDPLVPEMMHLCVELSRYTYAPPSSYEVFKLLHKHFKDNEYTKKTPYHYWHEGNSETDGD